MTKPELTNREVLDGLMKILTSMRKKHTEKGRILYAARRIIREQATEIEDLRNALKFAEDNDAVIKATRQANSPQPQDSDT